MFVENQKIYFAVRELRRFRRVLSGDPIREGKTEYFDPDGNRLQKEGWREGNLHGSFVQWYPTGTVREQGEYRLGAKTGVWELHDASGNLDLRTPYDANWRHGEAQWFADEKVIRTVRYDRGEIKQIDGRDVVDPIGRAWREGKVKDELVGRYEKLTAQILEAPAAPPFAQSSLAEAVDWIHHYSKVSVGIDRRALTEAGLAEDLTVDMSTTKHTNTHLMLVLMCEPHDLAPTFRFGMIWITTKDNAKNWTDRTGVSQVRKSAPPNALPEIRERIAAAWPKHALFDFLDTPCPEIGRHLADSYQVPLQCDERLNFVPITSSLHSINLQNALSALCDQYNLRVRWKDAGTLIIEPQDEASRSQARGADSQ